MICDCRLVLYVSLLLVLVLAKRTVYLKTHPVSITCGQCCVLCCCQALQLLQAQALQPLQCVITLWRRHQISRHDTAIKQQQQRVR